MFWNQFFWCFSYFDVSMHIIVTLEVFVQSLSNHNDWRQQGRLKFAYFTMKNSGFACFAREFFKFGHLEDVLVLSTTWNDLFGSCVDDVSIWQCSILSSYLWCAGSNLFREWTHFSSVMTWANCERTAEKRSDILRRSSRCYRHRVCLSS